MGSSAVVLELVVIGLVHFLNSSFVLQFVVLLCGEPAGALYVSVGSALPH